MRGTGGWVSRRLVSGRDLDGKAMQDEKEMEDRMSVVWSDQMCTHREREKVVKVTSRVMAFPPEEHHLGPIRLDGGHGDGGVSCVGERVQSESRIEEVGCSLLALGGLSICVISGMHATQALRRVVEGEVRVLSNRMVSCPSTVLATWFVSSPRHASLGRPQWPGTVCHPTAVCKGESTG